MAAPGAFSTAHAVQLAILRWVSRRYFGVRTMGTERLPVGPFLLAAGHHSILDGPLILAHLGRAAAPMLARGILRPPMTLLSGPWRPLPVDRQRVGGDVGALRAALDALREHAVLIFPEGTRRQGAEPVALGGVGWLALRSGVPVYPAALLGAERVLSRGMRWPRRVPLTLLVGERVDLTGIAPSSSAGERAAAAAEAIMSAIVRLESSDGDMRGAGRR